ncbi:UreD-domain-containing protein [Pluteus cervinus]|uniref:UreD-domain-containing protein n=1 Tax=Pluteus cervinus TaxID=181527 RepID=A0ACD3BHT3_9AGAR|nr:UreD-domain-containing protein [Pluteus cervinus]
MSDPPLIAKIPPGNGRIHFISHGIRSTFTELSSTYPLKLIASRDGTDNVGLVYILSYGGGLVGGDQIEVKAILGPDAVLVLLSQGSTKVFRTRPSIRQATVFPLQAQSTLSEQLATTQRLDFDINGALFLLPEPVTCFKAASYNQTQTFRLSPSASLAVLDWFTSGRRSLGEDWAFTRYYSLNEVWIADRRIIKDVTLLEKHDPTPAGLPPRSLADKLAPYACYATLILCGPLLQDVITSISAQYDQISVFKKSVPQDLIWSVSQINCASVVVRVAGKETETVKQWLKHQLGSLEAVTGPEIFQKCFA